jgi:excisionase family DNA binding protein
MKKSDKKTQSKTARRREIFTVKELAEYLKCHPSSLYRLIKHGGVPYFKLGSDYRFDKSTIDTWISNKSRAKS